MQQLQNALELYYSDNGVYPTTIGANSCAESNSDGTYGNNWESTGSDGLAYKLTPKYIPSLPDDPLNNGINETRYSYLYCVNWAPNPSNQNCATTAQGNQHYSLSMRLENPSNPSANAATCAGGYGSAGGINVHYLKGF